MSEKWGPWIAHNGRGCPSEVHGRFIHAWFEGPDEEPRELIGVVNAVLVCCESWNGAAYNWASGYTGRWMGKSFPMLWIVRYRIRSFGSVEDICNVRDVELEGAL